MRVCVCVVLEDTNVHWKAPELVEANDHMGRNEFAYTRCRLQ